MNSVIKPAKVLTVLILLISLVGGIIIFRKFQYENKRSGINLTTEQITYPNSRYSITEKQIYFNEPGAGYFLLKNADPATFQPLKDPAYQGTMAKDIRHVFFKEELVAGLNPATTTYLGNNFCKDGSKVFYADKLISNADAATFTRLGGYYAFDKNNLYYKQHSMAGADVKSLHHVKYSQEGIAHADAYIADNKHVYFKGMKIDGANPSKFTVLNGSGDQLGTQYAFDGKSYFNDQYKIVVADDRRNSGNLKLLTLDRDFSWHPIFYQGAKVYCYDAERHELVALGKRDNSLELRMLDNGIYTDIKNVYFTFGKWNKAGGRMPRYTGHTTGICAVEGATVTDFKRLGTFLTLERIEGTVYQCGKQRYFHPRYKGNGNYHQALMLLGTDGRTSELPIDNAFSKTIDDYDGPSIFSIEFYKRLWNPAYGEQEL
ncbi:DKNYY domain-containing protein [Pedobacter duraquae]|uniref:DKNYY family protein n=1 Tax=Pedobacter duraquae TaxID=425511 RepID=A0A4R6INV4_9SPHI|nr:DKNYY domain-containing protein [Pedobacter duraquae]TDO23801.1 DKNYY family protein [Pedobacter duraquae]